MQVAKQIKTEYLVGYESVLAIKQIEERSVNTFSIVLSVGVEYLNPVNEIVCPYLMILKLDATHWLTIALIAHKST